MTKRKETAFYIEQIPVLSLTVNGITRSSGNRWLLFFGMCLQERAQTTQMVFVPLNKKHIAALFWSIKADYKARLTTANI